MGLASCRRIADRARRDVCLHFRPSRPANLLGGEPLRRRARHLLAISLAAALLAVAAGAHAGEPSADPVAPVTTPVSAVAESQHVALPEPAQPAPVESAPAYDAEATDASPAAASDPLADEFADDDWLDDVFLEEEAAPEPRDFLEFPNRAIFGFNEAVYRWVLDPISGAYAFVVPDPARRSVVRFFDNLGEPVVFVNEVLQLRPVRAGTTGVRFLVNTTVGIAGLFDPATHIGLDQNLTDFGETLGVYGLGGGPYLVVPVLGPSNTRDVIGSIVDAMLHPSTYLLALGPQMLLATSGGFSTYDVNRDELDQLRTSSVDFYAAMRSAYSMNRRAEISDARAATVFSRFDREDDEEDVEVSELEPEYAEGSP